jgi:hypothetical protein
MRLLKMTLALLPLFLLVPLALADDGGNIILDQYGPWRMFHVLRPPEIAFDDGAKPVVYPHSFWLNGETAPPPPGWTMPDFDDSDWLLGPTGMQSRASFVARICLRSRFLVSDPASVKSLKLALGYHGGAVVCLNGEEIGRKYLAAGASLAEAYPLAAFGTPKGEFFGKPDRPDEEMTRRMALRQRWLEVELPSRLVRKGVNVLAIEIVRSPYHKVVDEKKTLNWTQEFLYSMTWNTCELIAARLTADGAGVEANIAWPPGVQVWNGTLLRTDFKFDSAAPGETLRPITLTGARNGVFSNKIVAGSARPIRGLQAIPSELRGPGGTIRASALRVRYGIAGGAEYGVYQSTYGRGPTAPRQPAMAEALSILLDAPPEEYRVAMSKNYGAAGDLRPVGAVVPVWLTVRVPADAGPGPYAGNLTVSCEGEKPVEVPVRLDVAGWTLPDPDRYRTWVELVQSPDTLQLEYGTPAWSDKHFELIARSFRLMREVGSGVLYLPLICATNYGNEESVVRWVKKGEKEYDFDFTVMDKYLDVAEKNLGRPKLLCFIVWDIFLLPSKDLSVGGAHSDMPADISRYKGRPTAPSVTLTTLDPLTGKLAKATFPNYFTDADCRAQWKNLFAQLRQRMKKRGLEQAMMLGWFTDVRAQKGELRFWSEVTGDLPWVSHAHFKIGKDVGIKTGYMTSIHDVGDPEDPAKGRNYGWKNPQLHAQQLLRPGWRGEMDMLPGTMWNCMTELTMAGGQRGYGRLGGDTWHVIKDKNGRRLYRAYERYPWSNWSNLELCCSLLAPGPEGAVATAHFEQFREGVQACEARIYLEQALTDGAKRKLLGEDLANRCQAALDQRILDGLRGICNYTNLPHDYTAPWRWRFQTGEAGHAWFQGAAWPERNATLYALAGEVEKKLATK